MSSTRLLCIGLLLFGTACNTIAGIDDPVYDPCISGAGGACASGGAGAGSAGGSGGATTTSSSVTSSSTGTPTPVCGNGVAEGDEQCDDGNTMDHDGCSSHCTVECSDFGAVFDPTTFHCYRFSGFMEEWHQAKDACSGDHRHLATFTSGAELAVATAHAHGQFWIDGVRSPDAFSWDDGEAPFYASWAGMGGNPPPFDDKKVCVKLTDDHYDVDDCNQKQGYVCEYEPAGR